MYPLFFTEEELRVISIAINTTKDTIYKEGSALYKISADISKQIEEWFCKKYEFEKVEKYYKNK